MGGARCPACRRIPILKAPRSAGAQPSPAGRPAGERLPAAACGRHLLTARARPIFPELDKAHWELADRAGRTVGRFARGWQPPAGMACIDARVWAIIRRRREQTPEEYQAQVRADAWEVVLPELVFQANSECSDTT